MRLLFIAVFGVNVAAMVAGLAYAGLTFPNWAMPFAFIAAFLWFAYLPVLVGKVVDPISAKLIRTHLEGLGVSDVTVQAFPNHYGVHFSANGKKHYAKCLVLTRNTFKWKGKSPEELIRENQIA